MSKITLGLFLGALLGLIDGASAYLYPYPDVKAAIVGIMIGSTFKGLLTGLIAGWAARRFDSLAAGIGTGLVTGFILSSLIGLGDGGKYYTLIVIPGTILGAVVGFAAQRFGKPAGAAATRA
jgi:hypothetical protein